MSTWKSVDVDVDIELEDVIDFIESASNKELEGVAKALREIKRSTSNVHSSIENTQVYCDLMEAVENAVNRHCDMKMMTDIINQLK